MTPWSAENAVAKNKSLSFLIYSSQSKEQVTLLRALPSLARAWGLCPFIITHPCCSQRLAGVRKKLIGQRKSHRTQGGADALSTNAYSGWKLVSFTLFGEQGPNLPFRDKLVGWINVFLFAHVSLGRYGRKLSERELLMNRDLDGEEAEQLAGSFFCCEGGCGANWVALYCKEHGDCAKNLRSCFCHLLIRIQRNLPRRKLLPSKQQLPKRWAKKRLQKLRPLRLALQRSLWGSLTNS